MDSNIQELITQPLSGSDILKSIGYKANLLTYSQLSNFNTLDEVLGPFETLILLYETKKHFGHWVCLFRSCSNTITFFDSYGILPDDELLFIPSNFRRLNNEDYPHLTALLYKSGCIVDYNHHKLQGKKSNTCGRFVIIRILLKHLSNNEFSKLFKGKNPDKFITYLTYNI